MKKYTGLNSASKAGLSAAFCLLFGAAALAIQPDERIPEPPPAAGARAAAAAVQQADAGQRSAADAARQAGLKVGWDRQLGTPSIVKGKDLGARGKFSGGKGLALKGGGRFEEDAVAVLDNLSRIYRIQDARQEFKADKAQKDKLGFSHVRIKQQHAGLPVVGGDLIVHFDKNGKAYQVTGRYVAGIGLAAAPQVQAESALAIAQKDLAGFSPSAANVRGVPVLAVYALQGEPQLTWEIVLEQPELPARWRYWVSAESGEVIRRLNEIKHLVSAPTTNGVAAVISGSILAGEGGSSVTVTGWYENVSSTYYLYSGKASNEWVVYNAATNGWSDSGTYAHRLSSAWGTSDRAEMSAARNFDAIQSYWSAVHGRNSFDGAGARAVANVHQGINYVNAYYDGVQFYFGDGNNVGAGPLGVLDVAAHEFAHGVTDYSADLIYQDESGALNESFSDIFGACAEFYAQPDGRSAYPGKLAGHADWLIGEDAWLATTALRDMRNPANPATVGAANVRASRYKGTHWYSGTGDNGGVHYNAGVQNHFFYLLAEGGSGTNDGIAYNLTGIGITNAGQVAYRALTVYCTPDTDYPAVRGAWISAAEDLNPAWAERAAEAWSACGVGALRVMPDEDAFYRGLEGGPFYPAAQTYSLQNGDFSAIAWSAEASEPWLSVTPSAGITAAYGSSDIQISVNSAANLLTKGTHIATVSISTPDGVIVPVTVRLNVGAVDSFTEIFTDGDNDLDFQSLLFTPDGRDSHYAVGRQTVAAFLTDPAGGTVLDLGDDEYAALTLSGGAQVSLYDLTTNVFYVGANGYITFGNGEKMYVESLNRHFAAPRVSGLFDDLDSSAGGTISWKQLSDRVAVTWQNVPEYGVANSNSFQIELFFDGRIRITWLGIGATDGLAGLSAGTYLPAGFVESDLSSYYLLSTDALQLVTYGGLTASGREGGPFTPADKAYTLSNTGAVSAAWRAVPSAAWLAAVPSNGTLAAGSQTNVTVSFSAAANSLPAGVYNGSVAFSNTASGVSYTRGVQLTVSVSAGEIDVADSVAPTNDLTVTYGGRSIGTKLTRTVTIRNLDATWPLTVGSLGFKDPGTYAAVNIPAFTGTLPEDRFDPELAGQAVPADLMPAQEITGLSDATIPAPSSALCYAYDWISGHMHAFRTDKLDAVTDLGPMAPALTKLTGVEMLPGDDTTLYALDASTDDLLAFDTRTGSRRLIGTASAPGIVWGALAGSPQGVLYGAAYAPTRDPAQMKTVLFRIDPVTAESTEIGIIMGVYPKETGLPGFNTNKVGWVAMMAMNAKGELYAIDLDRDELIKIDPVTCLAVPVGLLGVNVRFANGMDFDENNVLYFAFWNASVEDSGQGLWVIDTTTGAAALVGVFPNPLDVEYEIAVAGGASPFRLVNPPAVPFNVAPGGSQSLSVEFVPRTIGAVSARLAIGSNDADEPVVHVSLSGTGRADDLKVIQTQIFASDGFPGGPFTPATAVYTLTNSGTATLNWAAAVNASWIGLSPASGTLAGKTSTNVTVSLTGAAEGLAPDYYTALVSFSNLTSQVSATRILAGLTVLEGAAMEVSPASISVTNAYGAVATRTLTISNDPQATAGLDFEISSDSPSWLSVSPASGTGLAAGASVNCTVQIGAAVLQSGTYTGQLTVAGNGARNPLVVVPVVVVVQPDDLSVTPVTATAVSGPQGGPFTPSSWNYTVRNDASSSRVWSASAPSWLTLSSTNGTLAAGAQTTVTATINAGANMLPGGMNSGTVQFVNVTRGTVHARTVELNVTMPSGYTFFLDRLDTDPGWSREGKWEFGVPLGNNGDPTSGYTGTNVFGYNLAGSYGKWIPRYKLTTHAIDCSAFRNVKLNFWRKLSIAFSSLYTSLWGDHAAVEVSNDGVMWTTIWRHHGNSLDTAWTNVQYDISAVADGQSTVYIRWVQGPTDAEALEGGWNIDDISLIGDLTRWVTVTPAVPQSAAGRPGGPFTPAGFTYTLRNVSTNRSMTWTAGVSQPWLDISPAGGTIAAGSSTALNVSFNSAAAALPVGDYSAQWVVTNLTGGGEVLVRQVGLVIAAPGNIAVTDSVSPVSDRLVPFGNLTVGAAATQTVTVANTSATDTLTVKGLDLRLAPGTAPERDEFGGSRCVGAEYYSGTMMEFWTDKPEEINEGRMLDGDYYPSLAFFDGDYSRLYGIGYIGKKFVSIDVASGLITVIRPEMYVFPDLWMDFSKWIDMAQNPVDGKVYAVACDKFFTHLFRLDPKTGTVNLIETVVLDNATLPLGRASYIGGIAFSPSGVLYGVDVMNKKFVTIDPATAKATSIADLQVDVHKWSCTLEFDLDRNILYFAPLTPSIMTDLYTINPANGDTTKVGDWPFDSTQSLVSFAIARGAPGGAFELTDAPALPAQIAPGGSLNLPVRFAPPSARTHESVLKIASDDEDEPQVQVRLTGQGLPDYLLVDPIDTMRFEGHPGGPFTPASYTCTVSNPGAIDLDWQALSSAGRVSIVPSSGTLPGGGSVVVTISPAASTGSLPEGRYVDEVRFVNLTRDRVEYVRDALITIFTAPVIQVSPASLTVTNRIGEISKTTLTVGNASWADADLNVEFTAAESERPEDLFGGASALSAPLGHDFTRIQPDAPFAPDRMLVRFTAGMSAADRSLALQAAGGGEIEKEFEAVPGLCAVNLPPGTEMETALRSFNAQPAVLYAEPDYEVRTFETFPNDANFAKLWGMHNTGQTGGTPGADISAPEAWDASIGSPSIIVGVIDTGVNYNHPDLAANVWVNPGEIPGNGIDDDGNGYVDDVHGINAITGSGNPLDDHSHGSHCSGTIGGVGNNGIGVAGVCWNVRIMGLKFLSSGGSGDTSDAVECLDYAIKMGAHLTSNSWGGGGYSQALKDMIDAAGRARQLFVAAAGNSNGNNDRVPTYPATYASDNIISVMATDHKDAKASFSCYGQTSVHLAAPGVGIYSTVLGSGYASYNGTSMATPHVAGAAALVLSVDPTMSPVELKTALMATVDKKDNLTTLCASGGRLNVAQALSRASSQWITVDPKTVSGIAPGGSVNVLVGMQSFENTAPGSYEGILTIASNDPLDPRVRVPLTMVVLPDYLEVSPVEAFISSGEPGGPFTAASKQYVLTNTGPSDLSWSLTHSADWLDVSPAGGTLSAGQSVTVTAAFNVQASALGEGAYTDTLRFTNLQTGEYQLRPVSLTLVYERDYFTELFDGGAEGTNDLSFKSVMFTPNGTPSYYNAVLTTGVTSFVTDTSTNAGGIKLDIGTGAQELVLSGGKKVRLYGSIWSKIWLDGGGGWMGPGKVGDNAESLASHFSQARVAGFYDYLNPKDTNVVCSVTWKQLDDRVAVTFDNVPKGGVSAPPGITNSFQMEMFFDGKVRLTWLHLSSKDGLVGLSNGGGIPSNFVESDFSAYPTEDLPLVSVVAADPNAAEWGLDGGQFSVRRTGSTAAGLTVNYSLGGTAVSGADYAALTSPVVIPAGASNAVLTVTPLADDLAEGNETVILTVLSGSGYQPGAPASATVTIADDPLQAWRYQWFGIEANSLDVGGPLASPAGDGIKNLTKYALGINPLLPGYQGHMDEGMMAVSGTNYFMLRYTRPEPAPVDVSYQVQAGDSLTATNWAADVTQVSSTVTNGLRTITVRDTVPMSQKIKRYLMMKVTKP